MSISPAIMKSAFSVSLTRNFHAKILQKNPFPSESLLFFFTGNVRKFFSIPANRDKSSLYASLQLKSFVSNSPKHATTET
jgi:hypothetical protein